MYLADVLPRDIFSLITSQVMFCSLFSCFKSNLLCGQSAVSHVCENYCWDNNISRLSSWILLRNSAQDDASTDAGKTVISPLVIL